MGGALTAGANKFETSSRHRHPKDSARTELGVGYTASHENLEIYSISTNGEATNCSHSNNLHGNHSHSNHLHSNNLHSNNLHSNNLHSNHSNSNYTHSNDVMNDVTNTKPSVRWKSKTSSSSSTFSFKSFLSSNSSHSFKPEHIAKDKKCGPKSSTGSSGGGFVKFSRRLLAGRVSSQTNGVGGMSGSRKGWRTPAGDDSRSLEEELNGELRMEGAVHPDYRNGMQHSYSLHEKFYTRLHGNECDTICEGTEFMYDRQNHHQNHKENGIVSVIAYADDEETDDKGDNKIWKPMNGLENGSAFSNGGNKITRLGNGEYIRGYNHAGCKVVIEDLRDTRRSTDGVDYENITHTVLEDNESVNEDKKSKYSKQNSGNRNSITEIRATAHDHRPLSCNSDKIFEMHQQNHNLQENGKENSKRTLSLQQRPVCLPLEGKENFARRCHSNSVDFRHDGHTPELREVKVIHGKIPDSPFSDRSAEAVSSRSPVEAQSSISRIRSDTLNNNRDLYHSNASRFNVNGKLPSGTRPTGLPDTHREDATPSSPKRRILRASTWELLLSLNEYIITGCVRLKRSECQDAVLWMRQADRSLLVSGWQDTTFINPANVVFVYLLVRDVLTREGSEITSPRQLKSTLLICLYLSYSYMGNEISYPLKPFLIASPPGSTPSDDAKRACDSNGNIPQGSGTVDSAARRLFWDRCVGIVNRMSGEMLRLNSDPVFFVDVLKDLRRHGTEAQQLQQSIQKQRQQIQQLQQYPKPHTLSYT